MQIDEFDDDPENPDPSDMDRDDYTITVRCPNCRRFIDEQAEQCPFCGFFVTQEDVDKARPWPWWVVFGIIATLAALIFLTLR